MTDVFYVQPMRPCGPTQAQSSSPKGSYRPAIEPECRLAMTLKYLAHGDSRNMLGITFRTSQTSVRRIIYDTCDVIWQQLHWLYVAPPNRNELEETAVTFHSISGCPHCVGAIDGKHINIICPPGAGSEYYNYKGHHSVVLLAACDARYLFTYVDIGARGSESDGVVFSNSIFGQQIINNQIDLPSPVPLPGSTIPFPFDVEYVIPEYRGCNLNFEFCENICLTLSAFFHTSLSSM